MDRKTKGKYGEDLTVAFLESRKIEVLEKNYRHGRGEIDLIGLWKNQTLLFIEVKYRSNSNFGYPESFVSMNQQKTIISTADQYIHDINWQKDIRFDIMAINESNGSIEYFEDAFH
ncbi:MAG: YraN family protein [Cyclobacteriaceae bacterium]|nr:YraN family protein [Cyclobacteriaceae bacterium HetDA_MAG_MS6]